MEIYTLGTAAAEASTADILATLGPSPELERLGDEIAELSAHLDAATARLLDLIREFDARGGWHNGFASCAAWLTWRIGLAPGAAREHVRVARALATLPLLAEVLARGELSYSKIRELTRVATPETGERLLAVGKAGTTEHVARIVRGWRRVDRQAEAREAALQHASRALHVYPDGDGTVRIKGRLTAEVGALLVQALAAACETLYQERREKDPDADPPTMEQQQADALALLAETALHQGLDPGNSGERYQVVVHVDAEVLADADAPGQSALEDGARVPAGTSQRLACDASRVVMRHGQAAGSSRSMRGPGRFHRRSDGRCIIATAGAAFRAAACGSDRAITSAIGRREAPPRCRISPCSAAGTTAQSTRRALRSSDCPMARSGSAVRMAGSFPRYHPLQRCPMTL